MDSGSEHSAAPTPWCRRRTSRVRSKPALIALPEDPRDTLTFGVDALPPGEGTPMEQGRIIGLLGEINAFVAQEQAIAALQPRRLPG